MAKVYTKKCDVCGEKVERRYCVTAGTGGSRRQYIFCQKDGKTILNLLKKHRFIKTIHPKLDSSARARKFRM